MSNTSQKAHYEFIYLLKAICIILVVWGHTTNPLGAYGQSFRIPLFIFLSGLFFSPKYSFSTFLSKKVNTLLVPFFFFYFGSYLLGYITSDIIGLADKGMVDKFALTSVADFFRGVEYFTYNIPLWFLVSLFYVTILYYFIHKIPNLYIQHAIVLTLSVLFYYAEELGIQTLYFFDTAMVVLVFYHMGYLARNIGLLDKSRNDKKIILLAVLCVALSVPFIQENVFFLNVYHSNYVVFFLYSTGMLLLILEACKYIVRLPLLNFYGRFTLIILCTHYILLAPLTKVIGKLQINEFYGVPMLLIVFTAEFFIIKLFVKYLPWVVAQKPLLKENWGKIEATNTVPSTQKSSKIFIRK